MAEMAELVNLCPHALTIYLPDDSVMVIPPSGDIARVVYDHEPESVGEIMAIPVVHQSLQWRVVCLPPKESGNGKFYIVSRLVAEKVRREDVFAVEDLVRNEQGQVVGARALVRFVD